MFAISVFVNVTAPISGCSFNRKNAAVVAFLQVSIAMSRLVLRGRSFGLG
jgi:hypothetical protein